jgi:hypothetical protein
MMIQESGYTVHRTKNGCAVAKTIENDQEDKTQHERLMETVLGNVLTKKIKVVRRSWQKDW